MKKMTVVKKLKEASNACAEVANAALVLVLENKIL